MGKPICRTISFALDPGLADTFKNKFNEVATQFEIFSLVIDRPMRNGMVHILAGARGDPYQLKRFWRTIFRVELDLDNS